MAEHLERAISPATTRRTDAATRHVTREAAALAAGLDGLCTRLEEAVEALSTADGPPDEMLALWRLVRDAARSLDEAADRAERTLAAAAPRRPARRVAASR